MKPRPHSSPLPTISDKLSPAKINAGKQSRQGSMNTQQLAAFAAAAAAKAECLAMYEYNRIVHGKVKQISEYFLFMAGAKNGQYYFEAIEKIFEDPRFFSKPTKADHRHYLMLQWLGKIISKCKYSAEAWFQSVSLDNEAIFFNEFSASVLLLSVQCREPLVNESYVKELFRFITDSQEKMYFTRHDFSFVFRRMRMSNSEMSKLNQTAILISELCGFLHERNLSLRDFRLRAVQQQIQQQNDSSPANIFQTQPLSASSSAHNKNNHNNNHGNNHHHHRDSEHSSSQSHRHHHRRQHHYYADPAVRAAMETIGISECESLLTSIFNYQGRKTGTMPSLSPNRGDPVFTNTMGNDTLDSPMRLHMPGINNVTSQIQQVHQNNHHHDHGHDNHAHFAEGSNNYDGSSNNVHNSDRSDNNHHHTNSARPISATNHKPISLIPIAYQARPFTSPSLPSASSSSSHQQQRVMTHVDRK